MLLYTEKFSPSGKRVQIFLDEKGVEIPLRELDFAKDEHKTESFLQKNPLAQVPVLELDDGVCITESLTICLYIDKQYSKNPLFGHTTDDQVEIDMWLGRVEHGLFIPAVEFGHHTSPFFKQTKLQVPEYAEHCHSSILKLWRLLDRVLENNLYIASCGFSVVDISAYIATDLAQLWSLSIPKELTEVNRWYMAMKDRPSARQYGYFK